MRISAPKTSRARRHRVATAPMPPPEAPRAEVPVADVADRVVHHHVGGARLVGPAHVPIRPFTAITVFIWSVSNQRSRMSVDRHRQQARDVGDPAHRRACGSRHASWSCSCRSPTAIDPTCGGVCISSGPSTSASPPIHASHCGERVGVTLGELRESTRSSSARRRRDWMIAARRRGTARSTGRTGMTV